MSNLHASGVKDRKIIFREVSGLLKNEHILGKYRHADDYAIVILPPIACRESSRPASLLALS